jgi:type III pantothenate kinase
MNLLVDMGNTRLKWAMLENGGLIAGTPLPNQQLTQQQLRASWHQLPPPEHLLIACVSQVSLLALVKTVAIGLWPTTDIIIVRAKGHAYGVQNAYLQPEKLGVDRWLALVAVHNRYHTAACIVDCGTAITLDVLNDHGKHLGGLICPGLTLMKQALATGTQALEIADGKSAPGLADHTEAAIYNGTLNAAVGLIERVLSQQNGTIPLILTGGDARLIADQLSIKPIVDVDLVLHGLAVVLGHPL